MTKLYKRTTYAILLIWLLAVVYLMFIGNYQPRYDESYGHYLLRNIGLVPFDTTQSYIDLIMLDKINPDIVVKNLAGNLLLFVPLGFLLPTIFDKLNKFSRMAAFAATLAFVLEAVQLLTMNGRFDVDDIILRTAGALLGMLIVSGMTAAIRNFRLKAAYKA